MGKGDKDKFSPYLTENYAIFDNLIEGCQIISSDWFYIYVNDAAAKQSNLEKDFLLGKTVMEVYPDIEKTELFSKFEKCMNERVHVSFENEFTFPDGRKAWFESKLEPITEGMLILSTDITERKKIEESLIESEERYRGVVQNTTAVILRINPEGIIQFANERALEFFGYSKDELIGKPALGTIVPEHESTGRELAGMVDKIVASPDSFHFNENENMRKNGERVWMEWTNSGIYDKDGNLKEFLSVGIDATERKKAEEALKEAHDTLGEHVEERTSELEEAYQILKESEEKYRDLFNNVNDMITLSEIEANGMPGKYIEVNEVGVKRMGYSREEFLNLSPVDIVAPEYRAEMPKNAVVMAEKGRVNFEIVQITKDGKKIPIEVNGHIINYKGKKTYLTVSRDITERKKAKEELENHSIRLDILNRVIMAANRSENIESLVSDVLDLTLELMNFEGGGIYLINEDTKIAKIAHYKGLPEDFIEAVNNIPIEEYPHSEVFIKGKSIFMDIYSKHRFEYSKWHLKSGASVPIYSKNTIIGALNIANKRQHHFNNEEKGLLKSIGREIGNTITKLIIENNLKKTVKEFERSNKELQQFAYVSSHDLQEPLRTIASFTQLLQRRYEGKLDSDADEFMEYTVEAAIRMKAQIEGLLEYSRVGTKGGEFKPVDMNKILKSTINVLNSSIEESKAKITFDELPTIMGDADQLQRVFQNLISNSIKFRKHEEPPLIQISSNKDLYNKEYIFSTKDNGIGIEEQYSERIFTIFQRLHTREVYKGTGIGLSIVKRIIERHGGHIWVESEFGVGSTFYFTIPVEPVKNGGGQFLEFRKIK